MNAQNHKSLAGCGKNVIYIIKDGLDVPIAKYYAMPTGGKTENT